MTKRIYFIDTVCPKPYSTKDLAESPMGGTESTVIRVADALQATGRYEVKVFQHNREAAEGIYCPLESITKDTPRPSHVILLRDVIMGPYVRDVWRDAKIHVWAHDLQTAQSQLPVHREMLEDLGIDIITVSNSHKTNVIDAMMSVSRTIPKFKVRTIYNPIDDTLVKDDTEVNPTKLVFFSSPHKGLDNVLDAFNTVLKTYPEYELYVANPGYIPLEGLVRDKVHPLGPLPQKEALKHVREAFCVFYPSLAYKYRETFGLVFAEANAVGTPVLTHTMGAAHEVLHPLNKPIDCREIENIIKQLDFGEGTGGPRWTV